MGSVPAVYAIRRTLVELLQAREGLSGVQVSYGWPGANKIERDTIYTGGTANGTQEPTAMRTGRVHFTEDGQFEVEVIAARPDGTAEEADERLEALVEEVSLTIADNRNEFGVKWIHPIAWDATALLLDPVGFGSHIKITVAYSARLD